MRKAFTLLEVLLAIGLMAALSGGVFAFMWQIVAQKSALTASAMDGQAGDAVLERIESSLCGAVAADSAGNAGIVGTANSLKVLTRGVVLPLKEDDRAWGEGDLQGTEYSWSGGTLTARRWDAHRDRGGAGTAQTVSPHIEAFRLRYYHETEWTESFDSKAKDGLPVAVEVSLWFGTPEAGAEVAPVAPERSAAAIPPGAPLDPDGNPLETEEGPVASEVEVPRPKRAPDRMRVIVVPDGPTTAWKELR